MKFIIYAIAHTAHELNSWLSENTVDTGMDYALKAIGTYLFIMIWAPYFIMHLGAYDVMPAVISNGCLVAAHCANATLLIMFSFIASGVIMLAFPFGIGILSFLVGKHLLYPLVEYASERIDKMWKNWESLQHITPGCVVDILNYRARLIIGLSALTESYPIVHEIKRITGKVVIIVDDQKYELNARDIECRIPAGSISMDY